jgi:hypothetical protein
MISNHEKLHIWHVFVKTKKNNKNLTCIMH